MNNLSAGRGRWQGTAQILRFNQLFYARTVAGIVFAWLIAALLPQPACALLLGTTAPALFWICSSLLVSHYVYDRSTLYNLSWLSKVLRIRPGRWLNVHAGLDETSVLLAATFPDASGQVVDIYDPHEMTEQSIAEARRFSGSSTHSDSFPLPDGSFDLAILMFAAHELRRHEARVQLFRDLCQLLRQNGEVVLVEHPRDWANFLAFGPGFFHFFSTRSWHETSREAGLQVRAEFSLTPFVRVFILHSAPR